MSTSVAARGKIVHALEQGDKIPEGWAVDEDGYPTTNPEKALKGRSFRRVVLKVQA